MSDNEDDDGGQVFGMSWNDRNRAQGAVGEEYGEDPRTAEGKWNIKIKSLTRKEGMKFDEVKNMANQIDNYLNLNPYAFVLAYKIVNLRDDEPIDIEKLKEMKTKIDKTVAPDKEPFSNIMSLSDVIRYAYLIRATNDKGRQVLV